MVIVKLMGGMGNQMFQYALGFYLAKKNKTQLKLDQSFLQDKREKKNFVFREFDLSIFNITENSIGNYEEVSYYAGVSPDEKKLSIPVRLKRKFSRPHHVIDYSMKYSPGYKQLTGNIYLEGYFQSPSYFYEIKEDIRQEFKFKNKIIPVSEELSKQIMSCDSICLNVRRADFVEENLGKNIQGFVGLEYYTNAVKLLKEKVNNPVLFIFSDDIEWCRTNLSFDIPAHFVLYEHKGEKFGNYLQLMTLCKHFIIPNSTFAWWAAWLNDHPQKIVISPKQWLKDDSKNTSDIIPEGWITL